MSKVTAIVTARPTQKKMRPAVPGFVPKEELEKQGYGEYEKLFEKKP